ncbi:MAG: FAD-dependent oxidoreductase, partial [Betaproteobacteria bacterium]
MRRVGVVGAGWAGLAAAVELAEAGWQVQMWEMATSPGGRGRSG